MFSHSEDQQFDSEVQGRDGIIGVFGGCPQQFRRPYGVRTRSGEGAVVMAVPKRRLSRANTPARRSQWKATAPDRCRSWSPASTIWYHAG